MTYNLTEKQKEFARWLVNEVREGRLAETFTISESAADTSGLIGSGGVDKKKLVDALDSGQAEVLRNFGLLVASTSEKKAGTLVVHYRTFSLTALAYGAIDSNFGDTTIPPKQRSPYTPLPWEKFVATGVALAVIGVTCYLIVRNEPITDRNLASMLRTLLSVATAIIGATVPGFLHVGWKGSGLAIRASGAVGLFVITYFGSPQVLENGSRESVSRESSLTDSTHPDRSPTPVVRPLEQSFSVGDLATNGKRGGDANYGDVIWNGTDQPRENWIRFNVSSPVEHNFDLFLRYASGENRHITILLGDTPAGTFDIPLTGAGIQAFYYQMQSEHRIARIRIPTGLTQITLKNPSALPHISGVRVVPSGR